MDNVREEMIVVIKIMVMNEVDELIEVDMKLRMDRLERELSGKKMEGREELMKKIKKLKNEDE